jgi:hypothetical protein
MQKRSFIRDESAMINALMYAVATVILMAVIVIALGPPLSLFVEIANSFSSSGLLAPKMLQTLNWIFNFWVWIPVLVLICTGFYVLRRAMRKGTYADEEEF